MKIENNGISPLAPQSADHAQRVERKTAAEAGASERNRDSVALSADARLLARARSAVESAPEMENERLAQIRQRVESGDYTIQVEDIARKLAARAFFLP
ncbi:MAG: flagellar biosynthesis anti-sigma factor FlgM [Chloroflexota bacterium]|jgi:negative regulator of flagellin synthesis FlgM